MQFCGRSLKFRFLRSGFVFRSINTSYEGFRYFINLILYNYNTKWDVYFTVLFPCQEWNIFRSQLNQLWWDFDWYLFSSISKIVRDDRDIFLRDKSVDLQAAADRFVTSFCECLRALTLTNRYFFLALLCVSMRDHLAAPMEINILCDEQYLIFNIVITKTECKASTAANVLIYHHRPWERLSFKSKY